MCILVVVELSAQLLILLTDVSGVYDRPPSDPHAELIDVFDRGTTNFKIGIYFYYLYYTKCSSMYTRIHHMYISHAQQALICYCVC